MANLERIYTIPLGDAYMRVRSKRAKRAVAFAKAFALRHMKAASVKVSEGVNSLVFRDGMGKPPRRIKVRIVKGDDQVAKIWLIGEEEKVKQAQDAKKKADEQKKKEAEKKADDAKKAAEAKKKAEEQKKAEEKKPAPAPAIPKPAAAPAAAPQNRPPAEPQAKPASPNPQQPSSQAQQPIVKK